MYLLDRTKIKAESAYPVLLDFTLLRKGDCFLNIANVTSECLIIHSLVSHRNNIDICSFAQPAYSDLAAHWYLGVVFLLLILVQFSVCALHWKNLLKVCLPSSKPLRGIAVVFRVEELRHLFSKEACWGGEVLRILIPHEILPDGTLRRRILQCLQSLTWVGNLELAR